MRPRRLSYNKVPCLYSVDILVCAVGNQQDESVAGNAKTFLADLDLGNDAVASRRVSWKLDRRKRKRVSTFVLVVFTCLPHVLLRTRSTFVFCYD